MVVAKPTRGRFALRFSSRLSSLWPDAVYVHPAEIALGNSWVRAFVPRGWPREVRPGWLLPLLQFSSPGVVSLQVTPMVAQEQVARLTRRLAWNQGVQQARRTSGQLDDPAMSGAVQDAQDLRQDVVRGETRMLSIGLTLALHAPSLDKLDARTEALASIADGLMMPLRTARYQQLPVWQRVLPGGAEASAGREMDTRAAATLFPWISDECQHPHGQVWGQNPMTMTPVVIDRDLLPSPHSLTVAWSGAGKSFATKLLILRARYQGIPVIVIDPEGEYAGLAQESGVIRVGKAHGLNPLALKDETPEERMRRADFMVRWLEITAGRLAQSVKAAIRKHVRGSRALVLSEWLAELSQEDPTVFKRIEEPVRQWISVLGETSSPAPRTGLTVIDLAGIPPSLKVAAYLTAVEWILATLSERQARWVVFDEAWHLLGNNLLAPYLEELYRRARKWRTALSLVTQDAHDTLRSPSAQVCLRNSPIVLLMRPHPEALPELTHLFHLSRPEAQILEASGVGEGLLLADRHRIPLRIAASPGEEKLIKEAEGHAI